MWQNNITVLSESASENIPFELIRSAEKLTLTVKKENIPEGTIGIAINVPAFDASNGDEGYYVLTPRGSFICEFGDKPNVKKSFKMTTMPIFGVKNKAGSVLCVARGMKYALYTRVTVENGHYSLTPRFVFDGDVPYEDASIDFYPLNNGDGYSEMAVKYRELQLADGICVPIKERMKNQPELEYASEAIEVRIRMGWKPAPPTVAEQTFENEPEMYVATAFARVKDIIDEFKAQGIDKAQLCLVGWNKSGHDGRYPDMFPVEEKLGGESALRELISYAQSNGYQITCHTNSNDCYSISSDFNGGEITVKNKDGSMQKDNNPWSGGNMYHLCPKFAWEFAKRDLPKVAALGFRGLHYVDVMTLMSSPVKCCDQNHPLNTKESVEYYKKITSLCRELFGGCASEGGGDFVAGSFDYALNVAWADTKDAIFERMIPFWELVYHGIILSNPTKDTINLCLRDENTKRLAYEFGFRPTFYINHRFCDNIGTDETDLLVYSDEQLKKTVSRIKELYDKFVPIRHLQKEFMNKHTVLPTGEAEIIYSNGERFVY